MTAVPRQLDVRRLLQDIQRRLATLERGQRSTTQLAARVSDLELRVAALENGEPPPETEPAQALDEGAP